MIATDACTFIVKGAHRHMSVKGVLATLVHAINRSYSSVPFLVIPRAKTGSNLAWQGTKGQCEIMGPNFNSFTSGIIEKRAFKLDLFFCTSAATASCKHWTTLHQQQSELKPC